MNHRSKLAAIGLAGLCVAVLSVAGTGGPAGAEANARQAATSLAAIQADVQQLKDKRLTRPTR